MRFRECTCDFGRSICGSAHSRPCNGGFKKSAAYQTSGRKHRVKDDLKKWPCPVMCGIFQDAIYMHEGVSSQKRLHLRVFTDKALPIRFVHDNRPGHRCVK
jgi:hypothetical protein